MSLSRVIPKQIKRYKNLPKNKTVQGYSSGETPRYARLSGVLTVEAAVAAPCLLFFFVTLLFLFRVMQVQLEVQQAVDDTARKLAVYAAGKEDTAQWKGAAAVKVLFVGELSRGKYAKTYINGGILGISLSESDWNGTDVKLQAKYHIKCPIRFFGFYKLKVTAKADCRKWNGWKAPEETGTESDVWVYVAETGTVYHKSADCTHLALSIQSVNRNQLGQLRNESGGKYKKCGLCVKSSAKQDKIYITAQGDRYHYDLDCSGLKRTVRKIRLSEVGSRSPCSRCKPA